MKRHIVATGRHPDRAGSQFRNLQKALRKVVDGSLKLELDMTSQFLGHQKTLNLGEVRHFFAFFLMFLGLAHVSSFGCPPLFTSEDFYVFSSHRVLEAFVGLKPIITTRPPLKP